jgi:endo-1,4-beta-xylanase
MSLYRYILPFVLFSAFLNRDTNGAHLKSITSKIYIGDAMVPNNILDNKYKTLAIQEINCLTPGNEMKWGSVEGTRGHYTYTGADKLVEFGEQNKMKIRGHTLIWHNQLPNFVSGLNKTELETAMTKHITEEVTYFKGKIYAWDVLNEIFNDDGTYRDSIFYKNFGKAYVSEAFKRAHSADPNAKLYINDYSIEGKNKKSDALYELVKELQSQGVPIHGVGFQAHLIVGLVPHDLAENMKRFADLGLDVAVTELDIRIKLPSSAENLSQQAKDYATVFKACLSISRCVGVTFWGINDSNSWIPGVMPGYGDALPWDANYQPKPAVAAIEAALKEM